MSKAPTGSRLKEDRRQAALSELQRRGRKNLQRPMNNAKYEAMKQEELRASKKNFWRGAEWQKNCDIKKPDAASRPTRKRSKSLPAGSSIMQLEFKDWESNAWIRGGLDP